MMFGMAAVVVASVVLRRFSLRVLLVAGLGGRTCATGRPQRASRGGVDARFLAGGLNL